MERTVTPLNLRFHLFERVKSRPGFVWVEPGPPTGGTAAETSDQLLILFFRV